MPDSTAPTPAAQLLSRAIAEGRDLARAPGTTIGRSQVWIMKARASLAKIYGNDSPEVEFWCPRQSADPPTMTPQEKIASRLPSLDRLLTSLAVPANPRVFIGHGRSAEWLKLRIFLTDTLRVRCDEFNIEPTAGLQTASRIATMLASAHMAFLVMTAEDEHADGTLHARENVIHEIGLFQAKLGAERAIVMLEAGCSRFSNLDGLTTINFPRADLLARSEDIRRVMQRERALPAVA
jgi:predicted nucleotide-binding protein